MQSHKLGATPPKRIAVVRALQLGDMLCAVPALRAIRGAFPDARIALVGLSWARDFVARFHAYVDDFIDFPGFPGLPEHPFDAAATSAFIANAQRTQFDLVIQLHGSGSHVNELIALMGARRAAGFYLPGDYIPDPELFIRWPTDGTEARRLLRITEALDIPTMGDELEFPLTDIDRAELARVEAARDLTPARYVCVHPGARFPSRRWMPERFAQVADALAERGFRVVVTGTASERPLTTAVIARMRTPSIDLAGALTLGALAALLSDAALLVSNDTGVSHVAAGVGTRSVVIASGSDAARWAPHDVRRHRVLWQDVPCRPCGYLECPFSHQCATAISSERVISVASELVA